MKLRIFAFIAAFAGCGSLSAQVTLNPTPSRAVGQPFLQVYSSAPNGVDGRELNAPQGIALDTSVSPPILYVVDTGNNRVLAWRNAEGAANGAKADLVLGQRDEFTTFPQGPRAQGSTLSTGLWNPTGVAVDSNGAVYVADSGNNRVLRFPRPFDQPSGLRLPDLVIGQRSFTAGAANEGGSSPTARSLALVNTSNQPLLAGLAFDAQGNLYVSDAGNHRVLRFPASALGPDAPQGPSADLVLGQADFSTRSALTSNASNRTVKTGMNTPAGLAVDAGGRVFVADALSRVLVFAPPFGNGVPARRIMGISQTSVLNDTVLVSPQGAFLIGNTPFILDTGAHRILRFDPFDQWPAEETSFSPKAKAVIGQQDFASGSSNRGRREPSEETLSLPVAAAATTKEVYVADTLNHRVLIFPQQAPGVFTAANRILGQDGFGFNAPNLAEGRELFLFRAFTRISGVSGQLAIGGTGAVIDHTMNPPALYIADTFNNRILGYRDARRVRPGDKADLVIGQGEDAARFYRTQPNYGSQDPGQPNQSGLSSPAGLAVDAEGNLWVADQGNSRVLRFPAPFRQPEGSPHRANLVLGQRDFRSLVTDASERTMRSPNGLAFTVEGHLLVSDLAHNRVLLFQRPEGGDFDDGMPASAVFGQPDFLSTTGSSAENRMISPRQIAVDTSNRLYVADAGNNRVLIFPRASNPGPDPRPSVTLMNADRDTVRLRNPHGVYVSPRTGEIWVADTNANRVWRYPHYDALLSNAVANGAVVANAPLAVTQDPFGNLVVNEAVNRVAMYFPAMAAVNAANFLQRPLAPGLIASLFPAGGSFGEQTIQGAVPLPTELGDIQVLVNDRPAPLFFVSPGQINFFVPTDIPTSGAVELQVMRPSTGQVLAASSVTVAPVAPALFTLTQNGSGQIAALNEDNTVNGPSNPISRGRVIQLFGTGQGLVHNAPPDGNTHDQQSPVRGHTRVIINAQEVPASNIEYSGLAPTLIGVWQINVRIPTSVPPGDAISVLILHDDVPSNDPSNPSRIRSTIAVKQ